LSLLLVCIQKYEHFCIQNSKSDTHFRMWRCRRNLQICYCLFLCYKGKGKVHPITGLEGLEGERGAALLFLDLGARRGWVVSTTPRPFYPRERPGTHCIGGPVWTYAKNLAPTGIRSPDRPARGQSLYRLSYPARSSFAIATSSVLESGKTVSQRPCINALMIAQNGGSRL
jgi:hypothetical protein